MNKKPKIWKKDQIIELRDRFISQHKHEHVVELEYMTRSIQTCKTSHNFDAATMYTRATGVMSICHARLIFQREEIKKLTDCVENSVQILSLHDAIIRHRNTYDEALRKMQLLMKSNTVFFEELI